MEVPNKDVKSFLVNPRISTQAVDLVILNGWKVLIILKMISALHTKL